jgi:hypothetical protein
METLRQTAMFVTANTKVAVDADEARDAVDIFPP